MAHDCFFREDAKKQQQTRKTKQTKMQKNKTFSLLKFE